MDYYRLQHNHQLLMEIQVHDVYLSSSRLTMTTQTDLGWDAKSLVIYITSPNPN